MAKREVLGKMACPACDFDAAEIKLQKCGVKLYMHCPECNVQIFARTGQQEKAFRRAIEKTGVPPVKVEEPAKPEEAAPVEVKPAPVKVEKPAAKPAAKPAPAAPAKRGGLADALAFLGGN